MPIVVVTGTTGLIGAHVVEQLLQQGHEVRAAVRDPTSAKCQFLRDMGKAAAGRSSGGGGGGGGGGGKLSLVHGDLMQPGSYEPAITGADVVIHCAAVVKMDFATCPFAEIITPAMEGTRDIALTAKRCGIKRVVHTGSVSSIIQLDSQREPKHRGKPFSEDERRFDLRPHYAPYQLAKAVAEEIMNNEFPGEVLTILPTWTMGPQLQQAATSSHGLIRAIAMRELPMTPLFYSSWVDVRDVAAAHVHAAFCAMPPGGYRTRRYIVSQGDLVSAQDFSDSIRAQFKHLSPPTRTAPWALLWLMSFFDKRITEFVLREKSQRLPPFCGERITRELGFVYKHTRLDPTVYSAITTMMQQGCVTKPPTA